MHIPGRLAVHPHSGPGRAGSRRALLVHGSGPRYTRSERLAFKEQ